MEDFKDVMLSEPPQRFAGQPQNQTTSNALSLESYKGILLCDRPADVRANGRSANEQSPFLPPGTTDMDRGNGNLGLQPSIENRAKRLAAGIGARGDSQARRNPALTKHRKWLQSFASEMKKMKEEQSNQQIRQTVREATLREREAARRRGEGATLTGKAPQQSTTDDVADAVETPTTPPTAESSLPPKPADTGKKTKSSKAKQKPKPKWAMTEEEAEDAEFDEARDLMDFAADLDYETFIKDFEVQEALAIMRDRVREIAEEKGIDIEAERERRREDDEISVATASTTTRAVNAARSSIARSKKKSAAFAGEDTAADDIGPGWDDTTNTTIRKALQGDSLKLAERVLQSSAALRKVHSKMSMAKLLQDVAMEVNAGKTQRQVQMPHEQAVIAPKIASVAAEATGTHGNVAPPAKRVLTEMRQSKTQTQNLPYLYRCPSI